MIKIERFHGSLGSEHGRSACADGSACITFLLSFTLIPRLTGTQVTGPSPLVYRAPFWRVSVEILFLSFLGERVTSHGISMAFPHQKLM